MAKTAQEKLLIVLYGVNIVLWVVSMFTQGWLVFNIDRGNQTLGSLQTSLFYFKLCDPQGCISKLGTDDEKSLPIDKTMPTWKELQSMSITAVVLCAVCCLLVILPDPCSCKKIKRPIAVFLIILNLIAVLIELVLIIRMTVYIATETQNTETILKITYKISNLSVSFKLPYSIIIAGVGWLVGFSGCVVGYIHHSSLKKNNREREGPNQESAASAHPVVHTHQPPHIYHMANGQPPYGQPPYGQHSYGQPPHEYTNVHAPPEYYSMPMYTK
uniref:Uncharacterized protein LOC111115118 isoform X1 n=1 Tax=Crassostrea virginica TaxID=6565 RepID=A0A8B8C198_CRAVI|nr:uncharacterized protein LOC111115118 isoform X1 [Crassostrea virginica]